MTEEQLLTSAMLEVLKKHEKIPYTQEGLDLFLKEVTKLIIPLEYEIKIQSLEDMTEEDIAARRLPKMEIVFK